MASLKPVKPFQASEMSAARPCAAKNFIRLPANQVNTSSGLPLRYRVMFVWNVVWSVVFTLTVLPDFFSYAFITLAYAFLGIGSDPLEPNVTVLPPEPPLLPSPQAASRPGTAIAPAPRAAPRSRDRRDTVEEENIETPWW